MSNPLVNFIVRGFQFIFGVVILGLSVSMIRDHHWGNLPSTLGFAAAVGGVTILGALIGITATWISLLEGFVGLIVDGFVAIINAAGGIVSELDPSSLFPLEGVLHILTTTRRRWQLN